MPYAQNFSKETEEYLHSMRDTYLNRDMQQDARQALHALLCAAVEKAQKAGSLPAAPVPDFVIEIPADATHGDFAANLAMVSAKSFGMAPRAIAAAVAENLPENELVVKVEIAGPGFINLFLAPGYYSGVVMAAVSSGKSYGRTRYGQGKKVNVEFVSANPTGPMHLGNARGGALGDCLAEAMAWAGYDVSREFYINDAGNQITKFAKSLAARYLQLILGEEAVPFPEDGYQGDDIRQRAREFYELHGDVYKEKPAEELEKALVDYALPLNIADQKAALGKYRIEYDVWFSEQSLHESGAVRRVIDLLSQRGATYEKDGAVWYKATDYGEEKDEVLVRANGFPTYFAADIAYHLNKFERGFELLIDAWGADHHGHVARMKGAMDAVGQSGDALDIVLFQFVNLVRDGQPVRMSKRTGKAITLVDLLEEVPIDSARFLFNMREPGSTIEFDLDLAVAQDSENPVYYVQYAHARICSILRTLAEEGVSLSPGAFDALPLLATAEERALIRQIAAFPGEVVAAAKGRDPARITRYVIELATGFHRFYTACRIKGEEAKLQQARLALAVATQTTLANALTMLKVTVPERM